MALGAGYGGRGSELERRTGDGGGHGVGPGRSGKVRAEGRRRRRGASRRGAPGRPVLPRISGPSSPLSTSTCRRLPSSASLPPPSHSVRGPPSGATKWTGPTEGPGRGGQGSGTEVDGPREAERPGRRRMTMGPGRMDPPCRARGGGSSRGSGGSSEGGDPKRGRDGVRWYPDWGRTLQPSRGTTSDAVLRSVDDKV